ncbi:MAG TPA: hypothetical protein VKB80_18660 [Kofleriaceae bacterium]|nr:hypothetical protein [Kofleriaceae bacterium]
MSKEFLKERRETLEEEFFHRLQSDQIEALRGELERKDTRDQLRAACGIADDVVLDQLLALGLSGVTMTAVSMVPLVWVAWADGTVQEAERKAVLKAAHERGIDDGGAAHKLLAGWLERPPKQELFDAWGAYTRALVDTLVPSQRTQLRGQIVGMARKVAEAAGGFLGIHRISHKEEVALRAIEAAFGQPAAPGTPT